MAFPINSIDWALTYQKKKWSFNTYMFGIDGLYKNKIGRVIFLDKFFIDEILVDSKTYQSYFNCDTIT